MTHKFEDSQLLPAYVYQMAVGDEVGVEPWAIKGDIVNNAYVVAEAQVRKPMKGMATVKRLCDGPDGGKRFGIDLSNVPGERFARSFNVKVYKAVLLASC